MIYLTYIMSRTPSRRAPGARAFRRKHRIMSPTTGRGSDFRNTSSISCARCSEAAEAAWATASATAANDGGIAAAAVAAAGLLAAAVAGGMTPSGGWGTHAIPRLKQRAQGTPSLCVCWGGGVDLNV